MLTATSKMTLFCQKGIKKNSKIVFENWNGKYNLANFQITKFTNSQMKNAPIVASSWLS